MLLNSKFSKTILFTSTYFYPYLSGLTDYPLKIAKYLAKNNKVNILTFQHDVNLSLNEKYQKIDIIRLPTHIKLFKGLWNIFYPLKAWQEIKKADIVFINLPQMEGLVVALIARLFNKKTYAIYHCELSFNNSFFWQLTGKIANLSAFLTCFLVNNIISYTKDYAKQSQMLKYFMSKIKYVLPPVSPESVDEKYQKFLNEKYQKFDPIIGFSGRVAREKGLSYLLKALILLKRNYPKILLLIAGPYGKKVAGEEKYYRQILKEIKNNKLKAVFLNQLNKNQLSAFYKTLDVLVLPSINKTEAFGMVQVEAMLSNIPVVASNLVGVRVPIKLTGMGCLVNPKDPNNLAEKINKIIQNQAVYKKKAKAEKIFDIKKTYVFYKNLL